jgi:ribosomal RNA-processing protein 12
MTIIREDEEVVDFLDRNVVSQIAHSSSKLSKKSKTAKSEFPTNNDGMLVFDQDDSDQEMAQPEISEDYYKKSLASEVSFTRGADGRVKFLKRKRQEDDLAHDADKEIGKRWHSAKDKHSKPENFSRMLGSEYKSKKAKGDVKRAGMADPHAFIPLSGKIVGNM